MRLIKFIFKNFDSYDSSYKCEMVKIKNAFFFCVKTSNGYFKPVSDWFSLSGIFIPFELKAFKIGHF